MQGSADGRGDVVLILKFVCDLAYFMFQRCVRLVSMCTSMLLLWQEPAEDQQGNSVYSINQDSSSSCLQHSATFY